jgi:tetratricopeptide (TPR) repeat protein
MSLFPHQKLDWNLSRLEKRVDESRDDVQTRVDFALACLSRALFHGGDEPWLNRALTQARRVLQQDPANGVAHVVAGLALTRLDRLEAAAQHLAEAERANPVPALAHYARGRWHEQARKVGDADGDRHLAVREIEAACRAEPDAWEPHALLAELLWERAQEAGGPAKVPRLVERSQFHAVRALESEVPSTQRAALRYHLGITCLHGQKYAEANKLLTELVEDDTWRVRAQYYLGLVNYHTGRYKNAILYLRQHLDHAPETARVHARIAMAYLQLGEVVKARESCNRAIAIDQGDLSARWTLGCALVEEGREEEAMKAFKAILEDAPDHAPAFTELVRLRGRRGDHHWLQSALRAEVKGFDQLPLDDGGGARHPRQATRERISTLIEALGSDDEGARHVLEAIDLTTDESLRFLLWESALDLLSARRARELVRKLEQPGKNYSASLGREVLVLARALPEELLVKALELGDEDLRRAAVERHGHTRDVTDHRKSIDLERREARAWQALLLLSVASHGNRASRALLVRWADEADEDLADAARAALVMLGDPDALEVLRKRARARGSAHLVDAMTSQLQPQSARMAVRPLAEGENRTCTTCGRRSAEAAHMMVGANAAICNVCLTEIALHRREIETDDPDKICALSGRGTFETVAMYVFKDVAVCREVVDQGLGLLERERVDRWLAAL